MILMGGPGQEFTRRAGLNSKPDIQPWRILAAFFLSSHEPASPSAGTTCRQPPTPKVTLQSHKTGQNLMAKPVSKLFLDPNLATAVLLGIATLLLLLISLSVPVVQSGQLFRLLAVLDGTKRYVHFGLWGYCIPSFIKTQPNVIEGCSKSMFGITIDSNVLNALQTNPALRSQDSYPHLHTLFIAAFVAIVATALQITVVGKAKLKVTSIRESYGNIYLEWGNLLWLTVVATVIHFINLVNLFTMRLRLARIKLEKRRARRRKHHQHLRINDVSEKELINPPLPACLLPPPRTNRSPTSPLGTSLPPAPP
ncbi:hypothetical protein CC1G_00808 [Coprinopsis cinerea okayama7|uniref:Uncharacterized protein n=1 Tax=Coprinopsis cinerea (strain Okayama-7 / 130 / ATCC MYA-4618 / FGSC 9003) TaxID=240176 RepID=A8N8T3_COPC7|nr:hypothetical protein CC1G_00808 [Coprinopsis cinerea okayama7\|eukprot:XP_001831261.2 hypothetical protein CC1G_00808 [Coprinopsis cinerea okayama7\